MKIYGKKLFLILVNFSIFKLNYTKTQTMTGGGNIQKLFSFGLIADVQHADIDNGYNFRRTRNRYYRHAIRKFEDAVDTWNKEEVDFGVQLGDVLDGFSKKNQVLENDFQNVTKVIENFKCTGLPVVRRGNLLLQVDDNVVQEEEKVPYICHLWGNHEFYNFSRSQLWNGTLNSFISSSEEQMNAIETQWNDEKIDSELGYYYSFSYKGYRFLALDTYDVAKISRPDGSVIRNASITLIENYKQTVPRYASWNGGLSSEQLSWMRRELTTARSAGERVIVFSHVPFHPEVSRPMSLCWNYEDVLNILSEFNDCVVACFAGHYHDGGFYRDPHSGIFFFTFQGVIERDPATNAYGIAHVYMDRIEVKGYGKIENRIMKF